MVTDKQTFILSFFLLCLFSGQAFAVDSAIIDRLVSARKIDMAAVRFHGREVLPILADLYQQSESPQKRARIAWVFYQLGWKSERAREVMMADIDTDNRQLRLQVQWALGRVSNDDEVVDVLLDTLQHDGNALFREKAACALASDQIHLTEKQKFHLLEGLVHALNDSKYQVRRDAIKALKIRTGQTRGFKANADINKRLAAIGKWEEWLDAYRQQF